LVTPPKKFWTRELGSVVIQLYAGECTPSVDRALSVGLYFKYTSHGTGTHGMGIQLFIRQGLEYASECSRFTNRKPYKEILQQFDDVLKAKSPKAKDHCGSYQRFHYGKRERQYIDVFYPEKYSAGKKKNHPRYINPVRLIFNHKIKPSLYSLNTLTGVMSECERFRTPRLCARAHTSRLQWW